MSVYYLLKTLQKCLLTTIFEIESKVHMPSVALLYNWSTGFKSIYSTQGLENIKRKSLPHLQLEIIHCLFLVIYWKMGILIK